MESPNGRCPQRAYPSGLPSSHTKRLDRYTDLEKFVELWNLSAKDREVLKKAKNLCTGVLIADGASEPMIYSTIEGSGDVVAQPDDDVEMRTPNSISG